MLDKDKLWVQFNIHIPENIPDEGSREYFNEAVEKLDLYLDESVKPFFNLTRDENLPPIVVLYPKFYKNGEEADEFTYEDFIDEQNVKFRKVFHNGVFLGKIEIFEDGQ